MKLYSFRMGFKVGLYNFFISNRYTFGFIPPPTKKAVKLYLHLLIPFVVIMLTFNLPNSKGLLGNSNCINKCNLLVVTFVKVICVISFINGLNKAL